MKMISFWRAEFAAARVTADVPTLTLVTVGVVAAELKLTGTGEARSCVSVRGPVTATVPPTELTATVPLTGTAL